MKLLDEEPYAWHLLEHEGALYLNAVCSHSFVDYYFLVKLDGDEVRRFEQGGRDYFGKLAYEIHYSAPAVIGSTSRFKSRGLTPVLGQQVTAALAVAADAAKPHPK